MTPALDDLLPGPPPSPLVPLHAVGRVRGEEPAQRQPVLDHYRRARRAIAHWAPRHVVHYRVSEPAVVELAVDVCVEIPAVPQMLDPSKDRHAWFRCRKADGQLDL